MRVLSSKETAAISGAEIWYNTDNGDWGWNGGGSVTINPDGTWSGESEGWYIASNGNGGWNLYAPDGNLASQYY